MLLDVGFNSPWYLIVVRRTMLGYLPCLDLIHLLERCLRHTRLRSRRPRSGGEPRLSSVSFHRCRIFRWPEIIRSVSISFGSSLSISVRSCHLYLAAFSTVISLDGSCDDVFRGITYDLVVIKRHLSRIKALILVVSLSPSFLLGWDHQGFVGL
jgi:hypothetical protein